MIVNRDNLYRFISTSNLLLCLSVWWLVSYLFSASMRPYRPQMKEFESAADMGQSQALRPTSGLNEWLFKSKRLFSMSLPVKQEKKKNTFVLLGVSLGKKNLALIRDASESKDYYCSAGDNIGIYKVKRILKDKVILESEGNTIELIK